MSWKTSSQKDLVSGLAMMQLAIFWIVAALPCFKCSPADDRQVLADIRQLDSNRNIPALFKRTYVEWLGETACISQSLKSSEAEIRQRGPLRFSMKARISARTGNPLMKVELWLEFYNLTSEVDKSNRYEAIIRPVDPEIQSTNQISPEPVISEEGRLVEISFNVTDIYHTSKALGKKRVNFRISIRGHPKRAAKELHGYTTIKVFLIIQEYEEICNDDFPVRQPGRLKRDLDVVDKELALKSGGVNPSNEDVHHQRSLKIRPTMNTMLSILDDIFAMDISGQSHLQKQSSKMLLNLRLGTNTRTFTRSSDKKKRHFHHESEPTKNLKLSSLRDIMGTMSSDTSPLQKNAQDTLLSIRSSNSKRFGVTSAKHFNNSDRGPQSTTNTKRNTRHGVSTSTANRKPLKNKMLKTLRSDDAIWKTDGMEFQKRSHHKNVLKAFHPNSDANTRTSCGLKDWYVSFEHIGWDSWVIAPAGVRAKACSGVCSFPLGSQINSTAHAHLQSFVYYFKGEKWPACCVPNEFESLTMILYDVIDRLHFMAKYPNMIATSCACL